MNPIRGCDVETLVDFSRYYYNSWVGVVKDYHIAPAVVGTAANEDNVILRQLVETKEGGNISYSIGDYESFSFSTLKSRITFGRPRIGTVEHDGTVVYLSYSTPREPRKGLRLEECELEEFNDWNKKYLGSVGASRYFGSYPYTALWSLFNPKYTSFADAWTELKDGKKIGAAISRTVSLTTNSKNSVPIVGYKKWKVGYAPNTSRILLYSHFSEYAPLIGEQTGAGVSLI